jgi:diguanylate cyclase (GGDEF)-like protein/PAS domain S-box-containing protein
MKARPRAELAIMDTLPTLYRDLLDQIQDGVYFVDTERRITHWNKSAERISGFTAQEVIGRRCPENILMHVDEQGTCLCINGCPLLDCMKNAVKQEARVYLHHKDGHRVPVTVNVVPIRDHHDRIIGAVESFHDDSGHQSDIQRIKELELLVFLDELTGLANRRFLESSLKARLAESSRHGTRFGVLMVDIDKFKEVNDRHGHEVGDRVLKLVAGTMSAVARPFDLVARQGGEEFVIVLSNSLSDGLQKIADRFRVLVAHSAVRLPTHSIKVTISIGATMNQPNDDVAGLLARADALLYKAKNNGRNRVECAHAEPSDLTPNGMEPPPRDSGQQAKDTRMLQVLPHQSFP